jgi:hypothetical protein
MHKVNYPKQRNRPTLHLMANQNPAVKAYATQIRQTQLYYRFVSRHPSLLLSLGLDVQTTKWIGERYKNAAKELGLAWINDLRENHDFTSCPMCGSTNVTSLDHILPKEDYPELAVFSYNVVPSCQPCNNRRRTKGALANSPGFIHPYFDTTILDALELRIQFSQHGSAVGFKLIVSGVQGLEFDRVTWHLNNSINFKVFYRSMRSFWAKWWERSFKIKNASKTLSKLLEEAEIESKVNSRNSWEAAFNRGLAVDLNALNWMSNNDPTLTPLTYLKAPQP